MIQSLATTKQISIIIIDSGGLVIGAVDECFYMLIKDRQQLIDNGDRLIVTILKIKLFHACQMADLIYKGSLVAAS